MSPDAANPFQSPASDEPALLPSGDATGPTADVVVALVRAHARTRLRKLHTTTQLHGDLRIDGADAVALIRDLHRRCGVDMTGFRFNRHFNSVRLLFWAAVLLVVVSLLGALAAANFGWMAAGPHAALIAGLIGGFFTLTVGLMIHTLVLTLLGLRLKPLCIGDLIEAVETGHWPPRLQQ